MTLTVVPLSTPNSITALSQATLLNTDKLVLQTAQHPSAAWIVSSGIPYMSMDALYESSCDFDELNAAIADKLTALALNFDVVYAVPGRGPGSALKRTLIQSARERGVALRFLPGSGYAEAAIAASGDVVSSGDIRIVEASALPCRIDPYVPLCVEEIDTVIRASEVKLALSEYYPDDYGVFYAKMDQQGAYSVSPIALFELDRQKSYFASDVLIVPAAEFEQLTRHGLEGLTGVLERLRAPGGCPWDAEQTHESLRKDLIEETYEVLDALDRADNEALCEELGDLLLQVVFHAGIEAELRNFTMRDVTTGIVNKLVYRHPHVFGNVNVKSSEEVLVNWDKLKKKEKHQDTVTDAMQSIPRGFPALMRAQKLQKKAASVGFDWPDLTGALSKLSEEAGELNEAVTNKEGEARISEEAGDLLFSAVNAVRLAGCNSELALGAANDKFLDRFSKVERSVIDDGLDISSVGADSLNERWDKVKKGL